MGKFKRELKPCFNPKYIKGETDWNSGGPIRGRAVYVALECQGIMTLFTSKMKIILNSMTMLNVKWLNTWLALHAEYYGDVQSFGHRGKNVDDHG